MQHVYNKIAHEFDRTRYKPWTSVQNFLNSLPPNSSIGDIGCGNGKNMMMSPDSTVKGCDFSQSMVDICRSKHLDVVYGDVLDIPFDDETFDATICIAVLHHLSDYEKRMKALQELYRITKKGGQILVTVWAFEQESGCRRKFETQDVYVDWKDRKGTKLGTRYYHMFKKNELDGLLPGRNDYDVIYEKGNWVYKILKGRPS